MVTARAWNIKKGECDSPRRHHHHISTISRPFCEQSKAHLLSSTQLILTPHSHISHWPTKALSCKILIETSLVINLMRFQSISGWKIFSNLYKYPDGIACFLVRYDYCKQLYKSSRSKKGSCLRKFIVAVTSNQINRWALLNKQSTNCRNTFLLFKCYRNNSHDKQYTLGIVYQHSVSSDHQMNERSKQKNNTCWDLSRDIGWNVMIRFHVVKSHYNHVEWHWNQILTQGLTAD